VTMNSPATAPSPIQLEMFFDLSCPFTLLAKRQLDTLVVGNVTVAITWSPLILHPTVPAAGIDFHAAHLQHYGVRSRPLQIHVERLFAEQGLTVDHMRIKKVPNTLDAHRTVRFAAESGQQVEMIEAILRAYFVSGRDIGNRAELTTLVRILGLDAVDYRMRMASDWQCAELLAETEQATARGARSVPSYKLDGEHIENTNDLIQRLQQVVASGGRRTQ
jgi:predicted DsbA family dithiol-disulfide isomerase